MRANAIIPGSRMLSGWKELAYLKATSTRQVEFECFPSSQAMFLLQVPSFLITQVRRMNEATMLLKKQLPSVKKLLRRKTIEREVMTANGGGNSVAFSKRSTEEFVI